MIMLVAMKAAGLGIQMRGFMVDILDDHLQAMVLLVTELLNFDYCLVFGVIENLGN